MIKLEDKFKAIDLHLKSLKLSIQSNINHVEEHITKTLTLDELTHRVATKRKKLIASSEKHQEHESEHPNHNPRFYLKNDQQNNFNSSMKVMVHKLCRLTYKNEFKLFLKLRYYHIYKSRQDAGSSSKHDRPSLTAKQNFFRLSKITLNNYVAVEKKLNQLVLYDVGFNIIKSIQIKEQYNCHQMKVIDSNRVVLEFTAKNYAMTFIYIFDFDLNLLNRTLVKLEYLFIHFTQNVFFYRHPATSNLIVYDMNLKQIDEVQNEMKLDKNFILVLYHSNRLVLYSFNVKKIGFIDKKNLKLIKFYATNGFSKIVLYADMSSRVYLGMYEQASSRYSITCTDADGSAFFKRELDTSKGENFFFEDDYFYVFDKDYLLDSVN